MMNEQVEHERIVRVLRQFITRQEARVALALNLDDRIKNEAILADFRGELRNFIKSSPNCLDFLGDFGIV